MSSAKPIILAIDDAENVRRALEVTLGRSHVVKAMADGEAALAWAQHEPVPDLVLIDTDIAGASGFDLCRELRGISGYGKVPAVFLAEQRLAAHLVQAFELGAVDYIVKPLAATTFLPRIRAHLAHLAREREANLQGAEQDHARLLRALQAHDGSLAGKRALRLGEYARALAQAAGARDVACELLAKAAPLIDIGKLGVSPATLAKAESALTPPEREELERHPALGAEIIGERDDALLKLARTVALTYRERWDGSGFPGRLQGNNIPWAGRVMAIVDAFEKLSAAQRSEAAMSLDEALIEQGAGTQFDPGLMPALRKALPALRKIHETHAEQAGGADEDIVIGGATPPAAKAAPPAAKPAPSAPKPPPPPAPSAAEVDLTMLGPLRVRKAAPSGDKVREAIQRAAAKAQAARRSKQAAAPAPAPADDVPIPEGLLAEPPSVAAAPPVVEAPSVVREPPRAAATPAEEKGAPSPVVAVAVKRAQQAVAEAQLEALRARVAELESERAAAHEAATQARIDREAVEEAMLREIAQSQQVARAEAQSLRARVQELETEHASAQAALARAQAALEAALAEAADLRERQLAAEEALNARVEELQGELAPEPPAMDETLAELEALRARTLALEAEHRVVQSALSQAQLDIGRARADAEALRVRVRELQAAQAASAEQPQAAAELERLLARVKELEAERAAARETAERESQELRVRLAELEKDYVSAQAQLAEALDQVEEARKSAEAAESEELRSRLSELEKDYVSAQAQLAEALEQVEDARKRAQALESERAAATNDAGTLAELQTRCEAAEQALADLQARTRAEKAARRRERRRAEEALSENAAAAAQQSAAPAARRLLVPLVCAFLFGALCAALAYLYLFAK